MTSSLAIDARPVVSTGDLGTRPERDIAEIVAGFLKLGEGVVAHWVEYARGALLFVMAPGDARSGEFYIYDRRKGSFWLLSLPDGVFGGYGMCDMRQKIKDFRLLDLAEDPSRLAAVRH
ncbi:MAG: hypothetical protein K2X35_10180 [Bryobacteraceae bacterium]|nr:hypothetical protein [Bryobacteraceae bacterium]